MKRRDLIKKLQQIAKDQDLDFEIVREGAEHTIVRIGDRKDSIPRHREIGEILARKIIKKMEG